jgi:hypothetical protein
LPERRAAAIACAPAAAADDAVASSAAEPQDCREAEGVAAALSAFRAGQYAGARPVGETTKAVHYWTVAALARMSDEKEILVLIPNVAVLQV